MSTGGIVGGVLGISIDSRLAKKSSASAKPEPLAATPPAGTRSTGMPDFKSHEVTIEPTDEEPKTVHRLMEDLGGLAYDR